MWKDPVAAANEDNVNAEHNAEHNAVISVNGHANIDTELIELIFIFSLNYNIAHL